MGLGHKLKKMGWDGTRSSNKNFSSVDKIMSLVPYTLVLQ